MATRGSPPRKRQSSERDREFGHKPKKKRKESSSSAKEKSKHSKSSKRGKEARSTPGLRVRTVTELAALVSSGAVRVPQGLQHYVSDRAQLLDQVFTILSPGDISGMLPDVLKGLKMKQVKQLCLAKLKTMKEEDIVSVIQAEDSSEEANLSNTLLQLLEPNTSSSQLTDESQRTKVGGVEQVEDVRCEDKEIEINVSDVSDDDGSKVSCGGQSIDAEDGKLVTSKSASPCSHSEQRTDSRTSTTKSDNQQTTHSAGSSTAAKLRGTRSHSPGASKSSPPSRSSSLHGRFDLQENTKERDSDSSDSDQEDLADVNQLLEMELRQRALESALKRVHSDKDSHKVEGTSRKDSQEMAVTDKEDAFAGSFSKHTAHSKKTNITKAIVSKEASEQTESTMTEPKIDQPPDKLPSSNPLNAKLSNPPDAQKVGALLEQTLREKLLQSLAAKKR